MTVISPTALRSKQKKYPDIKLTHPAVRERTITDEDLKRGISAEELINRVHKRIDTFPDK